ncbi:MAG TPA: diacylglycerol kinase family protein [Anaerolineae bacterium]|nr:diacylglycerol kinase family protein [Anaerolineae bacterium]HQH37605.1 diacylglycerol kinase family protein [Anaerolineae bacterium]
MTPQCNGNFWASLKHAAEGLLYAIHTQRNFRIHLVVAVVVVVMGWWLHLPYASWAVLALTVGMVLVTEMVNTAAEAMVDLASPDYHPLAKLVKDVAAGAVLVTAITAIVVGLIVLGPPLLTRLGIEGC